MTPVLLVVSVLAAGCGGGSSDEPPDVDVKDLQEQPDAASDARTMDGFLLAASPDGVTLRTVEGDKVTFGVREADLERLGMEHLASHAGMTSVGFEVAYEQEGDERYIVAAREIPPPGQPELASGPDSTGMVKSASAQRLVIATSKGDRTFTIRPEHVEQMDIEHLLFHKREGIAVKVHYETSGATEYAVRYDDA